MKPTIFSRGRFMGESNEIFEEGKVYRAKFIVYERVVLVQSHMKVYQCAPELWAFKEEWKVEE